MIKDTRILLKQTSHPSSSKGISPTFTSDGSSISERTRSKTKITSGNESQLSTKHEPTEEPQKIADTSISFSQIKAIRHESEQKDARIDELLRENAELNKKIIHIEVSIRKKTQEEEIKRLNKEIVNREIDRSRLECEKMQLTSNFFV